MFDYILHFYETYKILFYFFIILWVIFEWPIIILSLSLIANKIWFNFYEIFFLAFLWDFLWDLLHFLFAKFFRKKLKKDFSIIEKLNKKLEKHSLFDKLLVIKYTPPITSLGLLYLWYSQVSLKKFIKNDIVFNIFSSLFITIIWYNFWSLFKNIDNFWIFISLVFISFVIFYFLFRIITRYFVKKIYDT